MHTLSEVFSFLTSKYPTSQGHPSLDMNNVQYRNVKEIHSGSMSVNINMDLWRAEFKGRGGCRTKTPLKMTISHTLMPWEKRPNVDQVGSQTLTLFYIGSQAASLPLTVRINPRVKGQRNATSDFLSSSQSVSTFHLA